MCHMNQRNLYISIDNGIIKTKFPYQGGTKIVLDGLVEEYNDAFIYPSFVDSHGHVAGLGIAQSIVNLNSFKSAEECALFASKFPSFRGSWVYGRGWNHELWNDNKLPDRKLLDYYFPDSPCYFVRVDGHSAWVNSKALEISGISSMSLDPSGGSILKDDVGKPTGLLLDNAMDIVYKHIPKYSRADMKNMILKSCKLLKEAGLSEIHDMDTDPGLIPIYTELDAEEKLPINIKSYLKAQNDEWIKYQIEPFNGNRFSVCGLKFYADGALGSRGAALLEPYSDAPDTKGLMLIEKEDLKKKAISALNKGFHIAVHAIGDAANRMVIDTFEDIRKLGYKSDDNILRIEHAQIVHPNDIKRIADNQIICSVQPVHCISDYRMAIARLGNRVNYSYPWKTLSDNGIKILGGSDFPIESYNPFTGLYAFTSRIPFGENMSWVEKEIISPEDAMRAYIETPKMLFSDKVSNIDLKIGAKADFLVLNKDLSLMNQHNYKDYKVLKCVY